MNGRLILQLGCRLYLASTLASAPWIAALAEATTAADSAPAAAEMPCHGEPSADAPLPQPQGDGCDDGCCLPANCAPAACVAHPTCASVFLSPPGLAAPGIAVSAVIAQDIPRPPPAERLRPPIR